MAKQIQKLSGGPLEVSPIVSRIFEAHLCGITAGEEADSAKAFRRRDQLLRRACGNAKRHVRLIGETLAGLCPR